MNARDRLSGVHVDFLVLTWWILCDWEWIQNVRLNLLICGVHIKDVTTNMCVSNSASHILLSTNNLHSCCSTFFWSVPFLGWLLVTVLIVAYLVLYFIPLRIIILLWGINKFTKRLRKPNFIPNNEVMDYLSRVPSNIELVRYLFFIEKISLICLVELKQHLLNQICTVYTDDRDGFGE